MDISQKILSDIVVFNKYAKHIPELHRRETWEEICDRNMQMHIKRFPELRDTIENIYEQYVLTRKILPSMRSMQFAGKPIEISHSRVYNCAYVPMDNIIAFSEMMFLLLGGTGVGYSVQERHVSKLPVITGPTNKTRRFLIGDSIEGWADTIKVLLKAYTQNKSEPIFDYRDIRPKGARLITSGGKAPGPDPLRLCVEHLRSILNGAIGRQLKTIEVHDMACHIADAVLAGGIRRAAMIAGFDCDDLDMLSCKSGMWWELNPQRGRANNSVILDRETITESQFLTLWEKVKDSGAGEPGFYWTNDKDYFTNPCCVPGDQLVDTDQGPRTVQSLVGVPFNAIIDGEAYHSAGFWSTGEKPVYQVTTARGYTFKATDDHKIMTADGKWVTVGELQIGDLVKINNTKRSEQDRLEALVESKTKSTYRTNYSSQVTDISLVGVEEVFDCTVDVVHAFSCNGVIVHNCEISLRPFSFCNLTEVNVSDVSNQSDLNERVRAAAIIGTLQASYTNFHYLRDIWKETTEADALIGVGMTGIGSGAFYGLDLEQAAEIVKKTNAEFAAKLGINIAARTSTIKPSGTSSCVVGSSSGVHAWHNDYYIRRMRVGKNEALYSYLKSHFPSLVEDCAFKPHIEAVVSIPQKAPEGAILRTESAMDLLERVKLFNVDWVRKGHNRGPNFNNVSCTISLKESDWGPVGDWMWTNREHYNGISVLPYDGGTYKQAPFEDCSKDVFDEMSKHLSAIDLTRVVEVDDNTDLSGELACAGGACEIK